MAKILTGAEVDDIMAECQANGTLSEYQQGTEGFVQSPPSLGRGYGRNINLRQDLALSIIDFEKHQVHRYKIHQHPQPMPLTFTYYLSGGCRVNNDGLKVSHEEVAGKSYLYCLPNTAEIEEYPAGCRICRVHIQVSSELIQRFSDRIHDLPTDLKQAIEHPEKALLYYPNRITPAQQQVLQQILEWPYHGLSRQLYIEGKVLELLALQFRQLTGGQPDQPPSLKTCDIDRIYEARDILIQNLASPPSLSDLSRRVHLNENKLSQGFRQVFDTTVFGYLHDHRMERARQILQAGNLNVQETAYQVGYTSRSSFVAAFKKKFELAPSHYLKKMG
ncbi:MAG: AraC family transcriptional regulator [Cyanobacteria bacterium P01_D01_bin.128]